MSTTASPEPSLLTNDSSWHYYDGTETIKRYLVIDPGTEKLGLLKIEINHTRKEFRKIHQVISLPGIKSMKDEHVENFCDAFDCIPSGYTGEPGDTIDHIIVEKLPITKYTYLRRVADMLLVYLIEQIKPLGPPPKVTYLPPITWRKQLGLKCNKNHRANKRETIKRIADDESLIFGGEEYESDIADCVAMWNVFLLSHKRLTKTITESRYINK